MTKASFFIFDVHFYTIHERKKKMDSQLIRTKIERRSVNKEHSFSDHNHVLNIKLQIAKRGGHLINIFR